MSENNLNSVAQENLSSETLAEMNLNPDSFTSGFVESNPFPGQSIYDNLTNQPFNSQPLQSKVGDIPDVPGLPEGLSVEAWTAKQNENILNKLDQAQSWGYDPYQNLKPYTFGTGAKHTNFDRYYHHPKFEELGFTPFRDNEALYNDNSSILDDLSRGMSQWDNIFASTIASNYRSLGNILTGDFLKPDEEAAYALDEAMNIGYSSRGGIMGGFNNLVLQSSIPVAMGVDFLASEFLLGLTGNIPGMGLKATQTGANVSRMAELLTNFPKLKNFYQGARNTGTNALKFALPNTIKNVAEYGPGTNKLANFANVVGSFADFYKDVRNMNYALSESKLEGGLVKNQLANDLIFEHIQEFGSNPDDQTMAEIYDKAQDAGFTTTAINFPIIFATNKLILDNLFTGPKIGARSSLEVLEAGLKNGKKLVYDAAKAVTGKAFTEVGMLGAAKASIKSLAKPSTYLRNGLNYFKANLTEGIQELTQEVVSGSTYDYYKRLYEDPAMGGAQYAIGDTMTNIKKQMSAEGFEVFASGFFMGGLMKVMGSGVNAIRGGVNKGLNKYYKSKNPEAYKKEYEENKANNQEIVDTLNKLYQDPLQFFAPDRQALIENLRLNKGLKNARARGDEKEFIDFSDAAKFNGIYNALSLNRFDSFTNMLKDMKQLDGTELKKALKLDDSVSEEEANAVLDKAIARAEKVKKNYDSLSQYQNPFNPERYRKKQINKDPEVREQYQAEALAYLGFEEAKKRAVFSVYGFERARERMQSIADGLSADPAIANAAFTDIQPLLSLPNLASEMNMLKGEIDSLEGATDDFNVKLREKKQKKLEALAKIFAVLENKQQLELFLDPATKAVYEEYFKTVADVTDSLYEKSKVENAIKSIADYYKLEEDANVFSKDVNTILDPNSFYEIAARQAAVFKRIYEEKEKYVQKALENYEKVIGNNELLNLLYDENIAIDPEDLDELKDLEVEEIINIIEKRDDITFIDTTTNDTFTKQDNEKFAKVQQVIDDFKARRPEDTTEETTAEEVIEETTETKEEVTEEVTEEVAEETPTTGVEVPVITNLVEFNKLPTKLKALLTSANASYNAEMGNEGDDITRPFQFASTSRGKKIISDFFNNPDNAKDVEEYNSKSTKPTASVPLTITSQVRQQLYDLGYSKEDVDAMKPEEAQDIIANQTTKLKVEEPVSDIEAKKADIERRRQEELTDIGRVKLIQAANNAKSDRDSDPNSAFKEMTDEEIDTEFQKALNSLNDLLRGLRKKGVSNEKITKAVINKIINHPILRMRSGGSNEIIKSIEKGLDSFLPSQEVNAKYDAELAALEQQPAEVKPTVSEEDLRADAELVDEYDIALDQFNNDNFGSPIERQIVDKLGSFTVNRESFIAFADKSNLGGDEGKGLGLQYIRKGGRDLDDLAQEASEDDGLEVTPQDIVDFMLKYQGGVGSKRSKSRTSFYGYYNPKLDPKYDDIEEIRKTVAKAVVEEVKTIRPELIGKVVYVTPGSGKSTVAQTSNDIIDGDDLLLEFIRKINGYENTTSENLSSSLFDLFQADSEKADGIYQDALNKANSLAAEGKTVLFGSKRLIPEVDLVIYSAETADNNQRIVRKYVDGGASVTEAEESVRKLRLSEKQNKADATINIPFDEYIFGAVAETTATNKTIQDYQDEIANIRTTDELRILQNEISSRGLATEVDLINAIKAKQKDLKENLTFDNIQVNDVLILTDGTKNTQVRSVQPNLILGFRLSDGSMVEITRDNFKDKVSMVYKTNAENENERIVGGKIVEEPTNEEKKNIEDNFNEYVDFTQDTESIKQASKEAEEQSSEDIDDEFFNDLGCK
jgi:hypothetical protein